VSPPWLSARGPFALTLLLAAALGMSLQPMVSKQVLLRYGGTPGVWSVVVVFFQLAVLAGVGGAHWLTIRTRDRLAGRLLLALFVASLLLLPVVVPTSHVAGLGPALGLLLGLVVGVGPVAVALSALPPLLQRWFAGANPGADPYPLYAASNLGSLLGLLAYPLWVEPRFDASSQALGWSLGFGIVALATAATLRGRQAPAPTTVAVEPIAARIRLGWIVTSALPCAALLAITAHITTDLAPVPLLWVLPLAAYLSTWIVAFSRAGRTAGRVAMTVLPLATAAIAPLAVMSISSPVVQVVLAQLSWLTIAGLALHGRLAATRPPVAQLTEFYLWLGLGGVLGGSAVAFVAPAVLSRAIDVPLVLIATMLAVSPRRAPLDRWVAVAAALVTIAGVVVLLHAHALERGGIAVAMAPFALWVIVYVPSVRWPRPAAWGLAVLLGLGVFAVETRRPALTATRSFFAAYRVVQDEDAGLRWLAHGRTIHGAESTRRPHECLPYHHPHSPAAAILGAAPGPHPRIAIVGLGIGCMAELAPPSAILDFFEIDAEVERLARTYFSALSRCGPRCSVTIADGRLALAATDTEYDLIVLDAFASDAIPVHLVTVEALADYAAHLAPGGTIAVHVTNQHADLAAVVVATAAAAGLRARVGEYDPAHDTAAPARVVADEYAATRFVALSRTGAAPPSRPNAGLSFSAPSVRVAAPWTDAHAPLLDVILE
jgi:hypothetical protein